MAIAAATVLFPLHARPSAESSKCDGDPCWAPLVFPSGDNEFTVILSPPCREYCANCDDKKFAPGTRTITDASGRAYGIQLIGAWLPDCWSFQSHDTIVGVNGRRVTSFADLPLALLTTAPCIEVELERGGNSVRIYFRIVRQ